ncbi:MAG: hypothetical protein WCV82_02590 [Candidatus Paceibacterota bacterium]
MARKQEKSIFVAKQPGETPLEALERYRLTRPELKGLPMTYAGRLDPMAEGTLLILIGDECKNKEKYLNLDKEYEVEMVFGITTDTYDALGLVDSDTNARAEVIPPKVNLNKYTGKFSQEYPAYSSKTVDGVQLHTLARAGELPDEMPVKDVEIYSIERLDDRKIPAPELKKYINAKITLVRGDFRQKEILAKWDEVLSDPGSGFYATKMRVKCSSGTYMRSLAHRIGKEAGIGAFALSIKRTKILLK